MALRELDISEGWCCDGRTHKEHVAESGNCCQPEGKHVADLPATAQRKAKQRMKHEVKAAAES